MVSHSKLEELFKARIAIINQYGKELAKVKTIRPVAWFGNYLTKELNGLSFHLFSPEDKNDFILFPTTIKTSRRVPTPTTGVG